MWRHFHPWCEEVESVEESAKLDVLAYDAAHQAEGLHEELFVFPLQGPGGGEHLGLQGAKTGDCIPELLESYVVILIKTRQERVLCLVSGPPDCLKWPSDPLESWTTKGSEPNTTDLSEGVIEAGVGSDTTGAILTCLL